MHLLSQASLPGMVFDEQTNAAFNSYLMVHPVNGSSNLLEVYDVGNRLFLEHLLS